MFLPRKSTMKDIFLIRRLIEKYKEKQKDFLIIFIDLENVYERVLRALWWALEEKT